VIGRYISRKQADTFGLLSEREAKSKSVQFGCA
jgi:hypothetical protein